MFLKICLFILKYKTRKAIKTSRKVTTDTIRDVWNGIGSIGKGS